MSTPKDCGCTWPKSKGWWCSRSFMHGGPCALRPKWWNLKAQWEVWGYRGR